MKDLFSVKRPIIIWNWRTRKYVEHHFIDNDDFTDYNLWIYHKYGELTYYQRVKLMNSHLEEWMDFPLTYIWNKRNQVWFVHASKTYYKRVNFYMYGEDDYKEFDREFNIYLRGKKIKQLKNKIRQR